MPINNSVRVLFIFIFGLSTLMLLRLNFRTKRDEIDKIIEGIEEGTGEPYWRECKKSPQYSLATDLDCIPCMVQSKDKLHLVSNMFPMFIAKRHAKVQPKGPVWGFIEDPDNINEKEVFEQRDRELLDVLQKNLNNPIVAAMHILFNNDDVVEYILKQKLRFTCKLVFHKVKGDPTYEDAMLYIGQYLRHRLVVLLNQDVYLGRGWERLDFDRVRKEKIMYALTRHGKKERYCSMPDTCSRQTEYSGSHDAFAFVLIQVPKKKDLVGLRHKNDQFGVENLLIDYFSRKLRYSETAGRKDSEKMNFIWTPEKSLKDGLQSNATSIIAPALSSIDDVTNWLAESEKSLDDDVINFRTFDLQAVIEKRKQLEDLYNEIESRASKMCTASEIFQAFCQMIPPCDQRSEKKNLISDVRCRMVKLRLRIAEQRERFQLLVPLLCHHNEHSERIKSWLDESQSKSAPFIDKHDDDLTMLEYGDDIEDLLKELLEIRPYYEAYLTYGETALDTAVLPFEALRIELDEVISRWDTICTKLERCLKGLKIAKKHDEESQKTEASKIHSQLRKEARKCACTKPFEIVRIGEGKYLFGDSKIVRLVRIHGSSVVVRVGGGWEFLLNFLLKYDPCRVKDFLQDGLENLKKLGMKPVDERRHSYAFETRKVFSSCGHMTPSPVQAEDHSHHHRDALNGGSCCEQNRSEQISLCSSFDSLDGASLGSDAGHTCNEKTTRHSARNTGPVSSSAKSTPKRKVSAPSASYTRLNQSAEMSRPLSGATRPKSATPTRGSFASRSVRKSLVEKQTKSSEVKKSASLQRTASPQMMKT
eukprot:gene7439-8261_t